MEPVEPDGEYRHRMVMNGITAIVCVLIIGSGIWLAVKMADLTRDENCVLGGRRNCAGIDIRGPHPGATDVR